MNEQDYIATARIATAKGEVELRVTQTAGTKTFNFWVFEPSDRLRCVASGSMDYGNPESMTEAVEYHESSPFWWSRYARALYGMLYTSQHA